MSLEERRLLDGGLEPEQLRWRRWVLETDCRGDSFVFRQEYPSNAEEAFLTSGRPTFDQERMQVLLAQCRAREPVWRGRLDNQNSRHEGDGLASLGEGEKDAG